MCFLYTSIICWYVGYNTLLGAVDSPPGCEEEEDEDNACGEPNFRKHLESQSDALGVTCSPGALVMHLGNWLF